MKVSLVRIALRTARTSVLTPLRVGRAFSKDSMPLRPRNPTMDESVQGTKFSKKQIDNLMNPKGFLDPKEYKDYDGVETIPEKQPEMKEAKTAATTEASVDKSTSATSAETSKKPAEPDNGEYGFKIKGPEPTRYGDWERKGRCFDF